MQTTELWSLKEKRVYTLENTSLRSIGGIPIVTTPSGEPLVLRRR